MNDFDADQIKIMGLLEPYLSRIYPKFLGALALYNKEYPEKIRAEHDDRAAASNVYCHLWSDLQKEFLDEPGFHFLEVKGLRLLNIRDHLLLRAKKVDENGRHRNNDTAQQRAFDGQEELPGLPQKAARLVIGYQPDAGFSTVERVTVRRPRGQWVSQIVEEEAACAWVDITPIQLPFGIRKTRSAEG